MRSDLRLDSSDSALVAGFSWAKEQALAYVFTGDPVGDWYEAALPGREAFCMRDVAHQSTGAHVLGLQRHTRNMLGKFAQNISKARQWCTFWEINRHDRPAPIDYRNDSDFWYNLPAHFDILQCCYRQFLWSGDRSYLDDPVFRHFYAKTVDEYVYAWDKDGDGIPEHYPEYGYRGIATYNEQVPHPLMGGDLIALQFAAYQTYAKILALIGNRVGSLVYRSRAKRLRRIYEREWWDDSRRRFASFRRQDGSYTTEHYGVSNFFPLLFSLVGDVDKASAALEQEISRRAALNVEERSYLPELLYCYERNDVAYAELMTQMHPHYYRREYPEVSYALIGALASGLMGITPDASTRTVTTVSRLPQGVEWVEMAEIPVCDNLIQLKHNGPTQSELTNLSGPPFRWRVQLPQDSGVLLVNGKMKRIPKGAHLRSKSKSWVTFTVDENARCTVEFVKT